MVDVQTAMVQQMNPQTVPANAAVVSKKTDGSGKSDAKPLFSKMMKNLQDKDGGAENDKEMTSDKNVMLMLMAASAAMPAALQAQTQTVTTTQGSAIGTDAKNAMENVVQNGISAVGGMAENAKGANLLSNMAQQTMSAAMNAAQQQSAAKQGDKTEAVPAGVAEKLTNLLNQEPMPQMQGVARIQTQPQAILDGVGNSAIVGQEMQAKETILTPQQMMQTMQQLTDGQGTGNAVASIVEAKPLDSTTSTLAVALQGKFAATDKVASAKPTDATVAKLETDPKNDASKFGTVLQQAGASQQEKAKSESGQQEAADGKLKEAAEVGTEQLKPQATAIPFASLLQPADKPLQATAMTQAQPLPNQNPADPHQVVGQIVDHAKLLSLKDNNEMVIRLNPEHLGEMTLRVSVTNGSVNASFHTDNPEVRRLLESSMMQLRQDLFNQGFKVDNVDIYAGLGHSLPEGQQQGQGGQPQDSGRQQRQPQTEQSFTDSMENLTQEFTKTADGVNYLI